MTSAQLDPSAQAPCTSTTFLAFSGAAVAACAIGAVSRHMAAVIIARSAVLEIILENEVINMVSPFGYPASGWAGGLREEWMLHLTCSRRSARRRAGQRGMFWFTG
jgi:hypothetical protein